MATLADSFLADFESSGDDEEESNQEDSDEDNDKEEGEPEFEDPTALAVEQTEDLEDLDDDIEDLDDDIDDLDEDSTSKPKKDAEPEGIHAISTLLSDPRLIKHLADIDRVLNLGDDANANTVLWNQQKDEEYEILVRSNEMATIIDNEIATIHKFVRDIYATKYHELEQLVPNPMDYAQVVKIIRNESDMTAVEDQLVDFIPPSVILTISVTATTTIGKPLPPEDLKRCLDGCDAVLELENHKIKIYQYIESRMEKLAPNLSAIVGPEIAARLIATAGGLVELSKIPACNLQVLGQHKKTLGGFSRATQQFHVGLLSHTDVMQATPNYLRQRCLKVVAARCVLATRMDSFKEDPTGSKGAEWLEEIWAKLKKWQEPPPAKKKKSLATPLGEIKKKRGGKRKRKEKERYEVTDMAKAKNRMSFAKQEMTDDYTGEGFGMVGTSGGNRLQIKKKDTQKLKNRLSRKTQARLHRIKGSGTQSTVSGIASTVAFSTVQGMELVAGPKIKEKKVKGLQKNAYFSSSGGFFNVGQ